MKMKKRFAITLMLLVSLAARAATITWTGPTTISGNTDINTNGASIFAYTGGTAATVNGVTFTASLTASMNNNYLQMSGLTAYTANSYTTTSNNFASLSSEYKSILIGGAYENAGAVTTNTLKNLVVGRKYTVQLWINDPRNGASTNRYAVLDATGPQLYYNSTRAEGGVGAYAVGTFTADATTQSFTLDGDVSTQLNAIQLRVESVPLTQLYWDANGVTAGFGTAAGTWGTDTSWSTNALGTTLPDQPISTTYSNIVNFGTTNNGLAAGYINVTSTQSFDTLSFGLASGPIAITNGTLGFYAPASTIRLNSITNLIGSSIAQGGALTLRTLAPLICDGFPTTSEFILFLNAKLSDYTGVEAKMGGGWISGGSSPLPANIYFWNITNATFQVQIRDGTLTKCVKIQLRQSGNDILGKAVYARYTSSALGFDFDSPSGWTGGTVATWFTADGYGVAELKLLPYDSQFKQHRFATFLTGSFQTIASNSTLSAFNTAECFMAGGSVNNDVSPTYTYYFVNSRTNATFQVQVYDDVYTKCVKVELVQAGNHIQARTLYAKYNNGSTLGYNFDLGGNASSLADSFGAGGYGIRSIRLNLTQPTLALAGENAFNGLIDIAGPTLILSGRLGNGTMSGTIINNGKLELKPKNIQQISGAISGTGSLVMNGVGSSITYNAATLTTTPVIIATNKPLAHYVIAGGVFGEGSMSVYPATLAPFYFVNDGTTATVQFQIYDGGHTKVAKVEFKQVGTDITAKIVYTKHCSPDANNVGADYDYTGAVYPYNLIQVSLYPAKVYLSGSNSYLGGTFVNSGELEVTTTSAIPSFGGIVVNGGNLILSASGFTDPATGALGGMNNPLTIFTGGTLTLANQFNAGHSRPITLDGGTLNSTYNNASDSINYVCNLTLKNGAHVTGNALRTGYASQPTFRIQGAAPSFIEAGLLMVSGLWSLEVDNVTGDDTTDLTISGNLNNFAGFGPQSTYKRNAGTVSLSGSNAGYTGPVQIEAGILRLDSVTALTSANLIYLLGGTLMSTTFSNSIGNVSLSTGTITMGTNKLIAGTATLANNTTVNLNTGSLAFADSSAITWTAGKTLNIVGTLMRQSIRFGTTASGLTSTQLQMIKMNGKSTRFILDGNGYLVELRGTMIYFK
jgi:autotransporter-associated beta strand protein